MANAYSPYDPGMINSQNLRALVWIYPSLASDFHEVLVDTYFHLTMTAFEDLFNKSILSVVTPESSVGFPNQDDPTSWPAWIAKLQADTTDRRMAFFDEQLDFLLTLHFEQSSYGGDIDPQKPPAQLLSYIAHLQVSYEASYISSITQGPDVYGLEISRPSIPPRSHSIPVPGRNSNRPSTLAPSHPSIFPPHTPNPIPSTAEVDKQYVQAQGTPLRSGVWGENTLVSGTDSAETFALLWDATSYSWIAVFRMSIQVAFVPTKMADPLLCLTVSTTLREKPVTVTEARKPLALLLQAIEGSPLMTDPMTPDVRTGEDDEFDLHGLEEVNLLEGLTLGPTFASSALDLPSTRLGATTRRQVFGLGPRSSVSSTPTSSTLTPSTSRTGVSHSTLRKSFRKTLRTVSGFHVRMRTVFVPYFMLPQAAKKASQRQNNIEDGSNASDEEVDPAALRERELIEAGTEENTVVLCIEVENGGESAAGFSLESVQVTVSGDGAKTHLIGWGEAGFLHPEQVFPLLLAPHEQYNLLYAVAFVRSPEVDEFSLARIRSLPGTPATQQLQRAVTIIIRGRPYETGDNISEDGTLDPTKFSYPTQTFPSRWNCVLDLSPQVPDSKLSDGPQQHNVLPTPASPFPLLTSRHTPGRPTSLPPVSLTKASSSGSGHSTPVTAVAGSKRHTLSALDLEQASSPYGESPKYRGLYSPVNYRTGTSLLNPVNQRDTLAQSGSLPSRSDTPVVGLSVNTTPPSSRISYLPPSITAKAFGGSTPRILGTTYGPLSPPLPSLPTISRSHSYGHVPDDSVGGQISLDGVPPTPAYPSFPATPPPSTPHWQGPLASVQSGPVGPSVEIRREKAPSAAGVPPTPGPRVSAAGAFSQSDSLRDVVNSEGHGEPIIVSVGLLPHADTSETAMALPGKIYPLNKFTLDIFVFNRSSWTRRFEVSYPDRRQQRKEQQLVDGTASQKNVLPGIIPLENRVRVGPLLPSTCQSVRMDFLALTAGVHSVDSLTLTDIQTGFVMNLRSVMDVVVHENELPVISTQTAQS